MSISALPPLLPKVDAILILDGDGNRLAGKYYGNFLTSTNNTAQTPTTTEQESKEDTPPGSVTVEDLRTSFERQLQSKIQGIAARSDAAEVVTVNGKTAVFCGGTTALGANGGQGGAGAGGAGGDVRVVHIGPSNESELVLAHLCEGMYDALAHLMGGQTDRNMVLDNLELVFLLIDEHCDGGIILEVDGAKLSSSVLLRDEDVAGAGAGAEGAPAENGGMSNGGGMNTMGMRNPADMSVMQAFRQAREQLMGGFNEGM